MFEIHPKVDCGFVAMHRLCRCAVSSASCTEPALQVYSSSTVTRLFGTEASSRTTRKSTLACLRHAEALLFLLPHPSVQCPSTHTPATCSTRSRLDRVLINWQ